MWYRDDGLRIDECLIFDAKRESADNRYSGDGNLFTSYKPEDLFPYISPYEFDTREFGIPPVSRDECERFKASFDPIQQPICQEWLEYYNKSIDALQSALQQDVPAAAIRAALTNTPFEKWPDRIEELKSEYPSVS